TGDAAVGRMTSTQFEAGGMYAPIDHIADYVWIRPYVGSALSLRPQTLTAPTGLESASDSGAGFRAFGGAEFTFASAPRFALSADVGYRRLPTTFPGFDTGAASVVVAGHWYVK